MNDIRRIALLAGLALLLLAAAARAQQTYSVKIDRPRHAGQTYRIDSYMTSKQRGSATQGGKPLNKIDSSYAIHFIADARVIVGDEGSHAPSIRYSVVKCSHYSKGDSIELIPPGTALVYEPGEEGREDLRPEDSSVDIDFDIIIELKRVIVEVGAFGNRLGASPPQPLAVGRTWKMPVDVLKAYATRNGIDVSPRDLKGTLALKSVDGSDTAPSMNVTLDIGISNFAIGDGFKASVAKASVSIAGNYPLDESRLPANVTSKMTFVVKGSQPGREGEGKFTLDVSNVNEWTVTYTEK